MRIVSLIKKGSGGTGSSSAARYVAFRDRDEQREGSEPRKLFERNIERVKADQEKAEQKLRVDRQILGRAMLAEDTAERLREMRDLTIALGDRRRYKIVDGRNHSRWLSEHDLRLKAKAAADRTLARLSPGWFPDVRRQMREEAFAAEMARYQPTIREIRELRRADLDWAEAKWQQALRASRPLHWKATSIRSEYESAGVAAPTPELTCEELNRLQDRAVAINGAQRFRMMEKLRVDLAAERSWPTRTKGEIGRLQAQLFVSQSGLIVEQEASRRFEEMKHLRRWAIGTQTEKDGGRNEVSLAEVERALAWQSDQAKFIGARKLHWDDASRADAAGRAVVLRQQREQVLQEIAAERNHLASRIAGKEEMAAALQDALDREAAVFQRNGIEFPEPIFSEQEMKELAAHADHRRDPQFHRELSKLECEHDTRLFGIPTIFADRVSRAKAREVMAGIAVREAQMASRRFAERQDQTTVIVKDDGGRNVQLGRLADVQPRTPLEHLLRPLIERSERYRLVVAAVEEHGHRLDQRLENAAAGHAILLADAREHEQEFSRWNPNQPLPRPQFTAWEIARLELHATKETDPALHEHYEQLYREAVTDHRNDSAMREVEMGRGEFSRTIVLDEREAASIFDSGGVELQRDLQLHEARGWERDDPRDVTSFER